VVEPVIEDDEPPMPLCTEASPDPTIPCGLELPCPKHVDIDQLHRREHEVFVEIRRVWPEWQECQHGKRCVEVLAHWSNDAPFIVTTGRFNSTQVFTRNVHLDGTFEVDSTGRETTFEHPVHFKCPKCGGIDTVKTTQEAYGDRTECTVDGCGYTRWYSIGD